MAATASLNEYVPGLNKLKHPLIDGLGIEGHQIYAELVTKLFALKDDPRFETLLSEDEENTRINKLPKSCKAGIYRDSASMSFAGPIGMEVKFCGQTLADLHKRIRHTAANVLATGEEHSELLGDTSIQIVDSMDVSILGAINHYSGHPKFYEAAKSSLGY